MTKVETYHMDIEPSTIKVEGVEYEVLNAVRNGSLITVTLGVKEKVKNE